MGKEFNDNFQSAREVFEEADEALGFKLSTLMFEGDQNVLNQTEFAQPAILTVSIASLRVLQKEYGFNLSQEASLILGHSLGEYTSLVAAESLSLKDAVKVVHVRGIAMQNCVKAIGKSTVMSALVLKKGGLREFYDTMEIIKTILPPGEVAELANINSSFQTVISGTVEGVNIASRILKDQRIALRAVDLPVSAPFHCSLMEPARSALDSALEIVAIFSPVVPIVFNAINRTLHSEISSPAELIKSYLLQQIDNTVPWFHSIQYCKQYGVQRFLIFGPNKVLGNLIRKDFPFDCVRFLTTLEECRSEYGSTSKSTSEDSVISPESPTSTSSSRSSLRFQT